MSERKRREYLSLRRQYEPENIRLVIVAESPPASGRYFYNPAGALTEPLFAALMRHLRLSPRTKDDGLRDFQRRGWVLIDATYEPVNTLTRAGRDSVIERDYQLLRDDLGTLIANCSIPLILIKENVCRILEPKLREDGFNVLNGGRVVYFPSTGRQMEFRRQFGAILETAGIERCEDDPRLHMLDQEHVAPLTKLIGALRDKGFGVPNVDPYDGGVNARALFLLESPGPRAVQSGFIARDNPDPSARNMARSLDQAGFLRQDVLLWNVVPHCNSDETRNQNVTLRQVREAIPHTQAFIGQLKKLKVIVFCGLKAQRAIRYLNIPENVEVLMTFHPGARAYNQPPLRDHIHRTFRLASRLIS